MDLKHDLAVVESRQSGSKQSTRACISAGQTPAVVSESQENVDYSADDYRLLFGTNQFIITSLSIFRVRQTSRFRDSLVRPHAQLIPRDLL